MNALKHGLSGDPMLFAEREREAYNERLESFRVDFNPSGETQEWAYQVMIAETLRIDACRRLAESTTLDLIGRAAETWEEDHQLEIEKLAKGLARNPLLVSATLRTSKYGCEFLAGKWEGLTRSLLEKGDWDDSQKSLALDLLGVDPRLRAGYPLFEIGEPDNDLALLDRRERFTIEQATKLREAAAEKFTRRDDFERENAKVGLFINPPKALTTAYRYQDAGLRNFERLAKFLRSCGKTAVPASLKASPKPEKTSGEKPRPTEKTDLKKRPPSDEEKMRRLRPELAPPVASNRPIPELTRENVGPEQAEIVLPKFERDSAATAVVGAEPRAKSLVGVGEVARC